MRPPAFGLLWTPGYWAWGGGVYVWRVGYWGPHVGFYGGVNYGFGYVGTGFVGGVWAGNVFRYNTAVSNVNVTVIHNTYNQTVVNNTTVNRVSYNGGTGGTSAQPTAQEQIAEHERHTPATGEQTQHENFARTNRAQLASVNHGQPAVAGTTKAGEFSHGVVAANRTGSPNSGSGGGATARTPNKNGTGGTPGGTNGGSSGTHANTSSGQPKNASNLPHSGQPNKQGSGSQPKGGKAPPKTPPKGKTEGKQGEGPGRGPGQ